MLRDWTDSEKMMELSAQAERFFVRLIMKADDYGLYHANPKLLKASLFPLLDGVRETDITRWMAECQKAGLILFYEAEGKRFLQIINFNQRVRIKNAKFPLPNHENICLTDDSLMTDMRQTNDNPNRSRSRSRREEEDIDRRAKPPSIEERDRFFYDELKAYVGTYGKEMLRAFYDYWREPNKSRTKMRYEQERTWDLNLRLQRWAANEKSREKKPEVRTENYLPDARELAKKYV